ncbi:hypothetical protein IJF89_01990 [Candidatus Saccharibacteria bacterium]|nr:hypothetical protein [Candidatus Saccharibacteria bacterium]
MFVETPFCPDRDDNESLIDKITMLAVDGDEKLLAQDVTIDYDGTAREFVPIFKDIFGTGVGDFVNLDLLKGEYLFGVEVDFEAISLICRKDGKDVTLSIPIDDIYDTLGIERFSIGVYHSSLDDDELVEAFDLAFDEEEDYIEVSVAYLNEDSEEEAETLFVPLYEDDYGNEDDDEPDNDEDEGGEPPEE